MNFGPERAIACIDAAELAMAGERLLLRADHSVYWPAAATLLVADTHFGKGAVFRRQGLALPSGTSDTDMARLGTAIAATGARRVVVLGDFLHAPTAPGTPWLARFSQWRTGFAGVEFVVTRGNHDRVARLPKNMDIDWRAASVFDAPFVLRHQPGADARGPVLAGHIHPVARLGGPGETLRAPVFWAHAHGLTLPAFSSFAGGMPIAPARGERVFAVGQRCVVEVRLG